MNEFLLIHGLYETNAWETKEQTKLILEKFFKEGFLLNPKSISLFDNHKLSQRPIFRNQQKINRPIIIKLSTVFDKQEIMKASKNPKNYRPHCSDFDSSRSSAKVNIADHLPKPYFLQKKTLMSIFEKARSNGDATRWAIVSERCILYVKDKLHYPKEA